MTIQAMLRHSEKGSPCYSPMATKQNFKATFFDSVNGLGAHKGQRRRRTDATIAILVLDTLCQC